MTVAPSIRDPLYGPIALDEIAEALIDTPVYQRLRRIRQLSEAYTVYPSAMHTRFEAGKVIFEASDPANRFYAIEQGRVAVESDSSSGPILIQILGGGDVQR